MPVGANLTYGPSSKLWKLALSYLQFKKGGPGVSRQICQKAGAPANNTANDNPNALGDLCVDTTNGDVYVCTLYSSDASATTWVKVTP